MKISYHKRYATCGTIYNQAISITKNEYNQIQNIFYAEIAQKLPRKKEYIFTADYEIFMKPLILIQNICYLNQTQLKFINIFLSLKIKNRNTCFLVN